MVASEYSVSQLKGKFRIVSVCIRTAATSQIRTVTRIICFNDVVPVRDTTGKQKHRRAVFHNGHINV